MTKQTATLILVAALAGASAAAAADGAIRRTASGHPDLTSSNFRHDAVCPPACH